MSNKPTLDNLPGERQHIASFSGGKDSTAMVLRLIEENRRLDDIVFFDTGWEFPQMYDHIEKVERFICRKITRLKPKIPFTEMMLYHPIKKQSGEGKGKVHRIGHGWPAMTRRWCTRRKVYAIDRYCKDAVRYIGIAADEARRMVTANRMSKHERQYPLVEWDMSEADCLVYCKHRGFDWDGLYDIFTRVSCFCCPLQRIGQLRNLRKYFPELWAKMLKWDSEMSPNRGFKGYDTVHDLAYRFAAEDMQREFKI